LNDPEYLRDSTVPVDLVTPGLGATVMWR